MKWKTTKTKYVGFLIPTWNMANFKAFCWNISLSSNFLFLKSAYWNYCLWSWIFFRPFVNFVETRVCSIIQLADFYHLSMKIHEKNYHLVKVNALLKLLWYVNHICKQKKKSVRELRVWTKGQACLNQSAIFRNIHIHTYLV